MIIPEEPYLGFAALCHIAGAFCLIPALLHTRTPQGTIAWLISLLAFPYIAVPFYLILGRVQRICGNAPPPDGSGILLGGTDG